MNKNIEIIPVFIFRGYIENEFLIPHVTNVAATFFTSKSFLIYFRKVYRMRQNITTYTYERQKNHKTCSGYCSVTFSCSCYALLCGNVINANRSWCTSVQLQIFRYNKTAIIQPKSCKLPV